jgi:biopolymer transport protein TolR
MAGHKFRENEPISEVNITPLVDVMLVLLIVFMVTAPLMVSGMPVDLPQTQADNLNIEKEPVIITLDKNGIIFLQKRETARPELIARLAAIVQSANEEVYIRADQSIPYGNVMVLMGDIKAAGYKKVMLVVEQP